MPSEVKLQSVTRDDAQDYHHGAINFFLPYLSDVAGVNMPLPPRPPLYWSPKRDAVLRSAIFNESMWAAANHIAITKMTSAAWEVASNVPLRARRVQELLQGADDNAGWVVFLSKHLRDFINCDGGAYFEVVRASTALGSKIIGLVSLDSIRCLLTGDPDIPVLYRDLKGRIHELRTHQVIHLADMTDPGENFFNLGFSACSRAYQAIYKLAAIEAYVSEKVSGSRPLAIHLVRGISSRQIEQAIVTSDQEQARKGTFLYKGAILVPFLGGDVTPQLVTIPLAEMPDGFDAGQERTSAYLIYANAIGLDPQDLQPLSNTPLGTGTQSIVLAEKAKGKGLVAWRQQFTHAINQWIAPDTVTFAFIEKDYKDIAEKVGVQKMQSDLVAAQVTATLITVEQGRQILVDKDVLPRWVIPADQTQDEILSDTDKPGMDQTIVTNLPTQEEQQEGQAPEQDGMGNEVDAYAGPEGVVPELVPQKKKEFESYQMISLGIENGELSHWLETA